MVENIPGMNWPGYFSNMNDMAMKTLGAILILGISLFSFSYTSERIVDEHGNKNKEAVAKAFGLWQKGTANFFDLLDENVAWMVSGSGTFSGTYTGKQDFIDRAVVPINDQLATKIKPELIDITAEGKIVWLHWRGTATTKTGVIYSNEYAWKLELENEKIIKAVAFLDQEKLDKLFLNKSNEMKTMVEETKAYIGMWVTADGHIRHELLPNNRYDEARGNRKNAYQGTYKVTGNHIDYKDDTGFTADGEFRDGVLYHAGMTFYKAEN